MKIGGVRHTGIKTSDLGKNDLGTFPDHSPLTQGMTEAI